MNILEMNHIKKKFDEKTVLKDISLSVKEGEVVSIIGPSGSGKSTLLRCATFLERADDGDISYCGEEVVKSQTGIAIYPEKKIIREAQQNFGLVFQNFNLFPHYSVLKNITDAPICNQKRAKDEVFKEARELLKKVGLEDKENAYPCELSGGQQQRVAIARALIKNPKILLCDELTGALDSRSSRSVLKFIEKVNEQFKTTIIIITHNEAIADMADTVIRIKDGQVASCIDNNSKHSAEELEL